ncbi:MAG: thioether cross-link-forming SCIFF peptide maturase [Eubacteriaceae bacterium]|nr:thioether cross-link-forming SCIFF peptide maturase [Eubacteriaceae bacterium]
MSIHKFQYKGAYIVVDSESANFFSSDEIAYRALDYYPKLSRSETAKELSSQFSEQAVLEAISEIDELAGQNKLFSKAEDYSQYSPGSTKALCLNISHDCNMACKYCFASGGGFKMKREQMSETIALKAVDYLIKASGSTASLEIDFFGGEPLMNLGVLKSTVRYARSQEKKHAKQFRFTLTTNALMLSGENAAWINENMENVVLSIDGRQAVHDAMRPLSSGAPSYSQVAENITAFVKIRENKSYYARSTFTRSNLDFSKDVAHLASLGIKNISSEPVAAAKHEAYAIREGDLGAVFSEYDALTDIYLASKGTESSFSFFHFSIDADNEICMKKRVGGCGAGSEYLAVTPTGDIYPCHQFIGLEGYCLGNVTVSLPGAITAKASLQNVGLLGKEECDACWAKLFCGGGCSANNLLYEGSADKPYSIGCEMLKKRLECALYIKTMESEQVYASC